MHAFTRDYFERMSLPLHERLLKEAEAEDRAAESLENCMWSGDEHPAMSHRRRASELREAAMRIKMAEEAPKRKREAAQRRKLERWQTILDAMREDTDW